MDIGIGLPSAVTGTTGKQLTDWARAAEDAGFSTLGTIDRIVYPNYEPIVALTAAATVTERIRLATDVMLGPLRQNPALVAKQVLSLDKLAGGGRAVLGLGAGGRADDYEVSDIDMSTRGQWLDNAIRRITAIWNDDGELESRVGPHSENGGPTLLVGGYADAAFERAARFGYGWTQGGSGPEQFAEDAVKLQDAWKEHGRDGKPFKMALIYFSLGETAEANAEHYLLDYYAWLGEETAQGIVAGAAKDAESVEAAIAAYEANGCDELICFPCSAETEQVNLLAEVANLPQRSAA